VRLTRAAPGRTDDCACLCAVAAAAAAAPASGGAPLLAHATDLGPVSASSPVEVTVWLRLHDEKGLDSRSKPAVRQGRLPLQRANPGPVCAERGGRRQGQRLPQGPGAHRHRCRPGQPVRQGSGTAARVQSAFQVELHQYNFHGREFRASARSATLPPDVAPLVSSVGGLSTLGRSRISHATNSRQASTSCARVTPKAWPRDRCRRAPAERLGLLGPVLLWADFRELQRQRRHGELPG